MRFELILSCEHAGNEMPPRLRHLFDEQPLILSSHEAFDIGAARLARTMSKKLGVPCVEQRMSRLLIDCNRSVTNRALFSRFSAPLSQGEKQHLLERYHQHREKVLAQIESVQAAGKVAFHVAVHSFTPELHGKLRSCDLGLLYDPQRALESRFCRGWQQILLRGMPGIRVRRNYPYRGTSDGLTTALRRHFRASSYVGVELEVNQAALQREDREVEALSAAVCTSLSSWPFCRQEEGVNLPPRQGLQRIGRVCPRGGAKGGPFSFHG
jgi:predicted N-formylglutamate amidohydrolase